MYIRAVHAESNISKLQQLIQSTTLGIFTTAISTSNHPTIQSSHIPFILDIPPSPTSDSVPEKGHLGTLRGHLARQNPQSKAIIESLVSSNSPSNVLADEVLVLFTSPVNHYVTPKFYKETKPLTGKVVPTWNYAAAQVYGRAKIYHDASSTETKAFLAKQIRDLSDHAERSVFGFTGQDGRENAWMVDDAPERYIELLTKNIVGVEIVIERLEGKFKMSQEMGKGDMDGVVEGFEGLESDIGLGMAGVVREVNRRKES